tara:strand:- start:1192 stop:1956 length:765 start_codon:yes stop_codon:yes gene_type:complete
MSTIEVNKIIPQSGTDVQVGEAGDTVTLPAGSVGNADLANDSITINGSSVALGGSVTVQPALTFPTFTSVSPSTITNAQTSVTITGTGFQSGIHVEAISTTGEIVVADTVTFTNSTTISANFTITTDGTYFIRLENTDGLAVRSTSAVLTVSDAPTWTTAAGSLGSVDQGQAGSFTVAATGDAPLAYSKTTGSFPSGFTLNSSTGVISGTESGSDSANTTYNFTLRVTDNESQTADRSFSIQVVVGINNAMGFN